MTRIEIAREKKRIEDAKKTGVRQGIRKGLGFAKKAVAKVHVPKRAAGTTVKPKRAAKKRARKTGGPRKPRKKTAAEEKAWAGNEYGS